MDSKTKRELLAQLFTTSKRDNGEEYIHFTDTAIYSTGPLQAVYKAVSAAQHDSGISFNFSYEIASRAVSILADLEDWEDEDELHGMIDSSVPVYNSELTKIYASDWDIVDEACSDMGYTDNDSIRRAAIGWDNAIENMVQAIKTNCESL